MRNNKKKTVYLIAAVEERKIALKKVKKGNTDENIKNHRIKRDKAKAIITKTKTSSWTNFINYINTNPKQAWNQIDNIRGIKKRRTTYR